MPCLRLGLHLPNWFAFSLAYIVMNNWLAVSFRPPIHCPLCPVLPFHLPWEHWKNHEVLTSSSFSKSREPKFLLEELRSKHCFGLSRSRQNIPKRPPRTRTTIGLCVKTLHHKGTVAKHIQKRSHSSSVHTQGPWFLPKISKEGHHFDRRQIDHLSSPLPPKRRNLIGLFPGTFQAKCRHSPRARSRKCGIRRPLQTS